MSDNSTVVDTEFVAAQKFRPTTSRVQRVWSQLRSESRAERYGEAVRHHLTMTAVQTLVEAGTHESIAVTRVEAPVHRSTYRNWVIRHRKYGFEGLISCRLPQPPECVPEATQEIVCNLRRADADLSVDSIIACIRHDHGRKISASSVKRILKAKGLARSPGRPPGKGVEQPKGRRLVLGGMKLVEAAASSTGYLEKMTEAVIQRVDSLVAPEGALPPDVDDRDDGGRFLSCYNERYRKTDEDVVAPGFVSTDVKRETKDPSLFHVHGAKTSTVERKLWALICSPVIGTGSWDGMRTPRGKLLGELCGYEYMPSTLSLFTSELKYAAVSDCMWEAHARHWHSESSDWGGPRHAAILYVDGTSKPIWTTQNSQCTHLSLLNRTMPGLDIVGFHNGYGCPLWYLGHSGRAPLVKVVPEAIDRLENQLGSIVARIVVIDAEGNSIPFLMGLEKAGRGWVTRMRPAMVEDKKVINQSSFRPYRDNDRIRESEVELRLSKTETLKIRLLEIERRKTGKVVYLAASKNLRVQEWKTAEVADLYYDRWPKQELNFRDVNEATKFKRVKGFGKKLVQNIAVTTKLERVLASEGRTKKRIDAQSERLGGLESKRDVQKQALRLSKDEGRGSHPELGLN